MVLPFSQAGLVWKGPLANTYATVHEDYCELVCIFQSKGKLVVKDGVYCVLEAHRRDTRRVDGVTQRCVFSEAGIN